MFDANRKVSLECYPEDIFSSCKVCTQHKGAFANFLSGGFTTMAVMNLPEKKLEKHTSVLCCKIYQTTVLPTATVGEQYFRSEISRN